MLDSAGWGGLGWIGACCCAEQNANQATGHDVEEKAAQELMSRNSHDLVFAAVGIISPTE